MSQTSHDARAVVRALDAQPTNADDAATTGDDAAAHASIAAALTAEHYRRAEARIVASPEEHCAAMADAVVRVLPAWLARGVRDLSAEQQDADVPTTTDDGPRVPCPDCLGAPLFRPDEITDHIVRQHTGTQQAPAADEDAQRTARRNSAAVLLARAVHGVLTPAEAEELRKHVNAETREHDTMRAVAAGNKRHVQMMYADLQQAQAGRAEEERLRLALAAERDRWKERADEAQAAIERVRELRDPIAEAIEQADYSGKMRRGDLADSVMPVLLAALDGTEQPTTEA